MFQHHDYITIRDAMDLMPCTRQWLHKLRRAERDRMGEEDHMGRIVFHRPTFMAWLNDYNRARRKPWKGNP